MTYNKNFVIILLYRGERDNYDSNITGKYEHSVHSYPLLCAGPGDDQQFASIVQRQVLGLRKARMAVRIRLEALYQRTRLRRMTT